MNKLFIFILIAIFLLSFNCPIVHLNEKGDKPVMVFDPFPEIPYKDMVSINGGNCIQISGSESFDHTLSNFSMAKYEVTYELWYRVYQWALVNGYTFTNAGREGNVGTIGSAPTVLKYEPVTYINWRDAMVWCNAYSEITYLSPCYTYEDAVIKDSRNTNATECDGAVCRWSASGYRLPSEGEWQFTASDKGATPWNYASGATADYNNATETQKVAWYNANGGSTHAVGTTINPSALTLRDLSGNVWEWCWDWLGSYPVSAQTDYRGSSSGSKRVGRGGGWNYDAGAMRIDFRGSSAPGSMSYDIGFRVAKTNY